MTTFHPVVESWFKERIGKPTPPQVDGWPAIKSRVPTLIAAPTGSGKTFAAFLVCIDELLQKSIAGNLADETTVLYISPLKALSEDIRLNLIGPLSELAERSGAAAAIRVAVRTGDTPAAKRQAMIKSPPHILVTTPESLYILLTSDGGRTLLKTVRTVIIDEIHALARDKRGSHLALSLARLDHVTDQKPLRIGLSATQKPIERVADFLIGEKEGHKKCRIVDSGHKRRLDLGIIVPTSEISAVCTNEQWEELYADLAKTIEDHRSTLIFVNTRKLAERVAFNLRRHLGHERVAAHHGSLAKEVRRDAETRLKQGELKAIVATASLELGIDVGHIDLVVQVGSPRSIATFLQRVGRAGHNVHATPKGRIVAVTRDDLIESAALLFALGRGDLDAIEIPTAPIDILAQQVIAETALKEWDVKDLWQVVRSSYPYQDLPESEFKSLLGMLAEGYGTGQRSRSLIHYDRINGKVKAKKSAKLKAVMSGGAIPEMGDYDVIIEGEGTKVGTINEDFALESSAGDVFLLGNTSWQIVNVRGGKVNVRDAGGVPPTLPFWLGEAPGRTVELSKAVSDLREAIANTIGYDSLQIHPIASATSLVEFRNVTPPPYASAFEWLRENTGILGWGALQLVHYIAAQKTALGAVPTQKKVIFERFFDTTGGMQLVIHAPFGMRINRGFGLALRKRFCRTFDFELQASADDNGVVLSIGPSQSFPIESLFSFLTPDNITALLEQAVLQVPLFQIRWRWNLNRSLAVLRAEAGRRVPPALQRFRADDMMTAVFPAQTQCQENVVGDIPLPDHPLVKQTMYDCLNEAIDLPRVTKLLQDIKSGDVVLEARETREPSPFAHQLLNANPYAFLDDAPLEERRARAMSVRRELALDVLKDLDQIDADVAASVTESAAPLVRDPEELHDALLTAKIIVSEEIKPEWIPWFESLRSTRRALTIAIPEGKGWIAAESFPLFQSAFPEAEFEFVPVLPPEIASTTRAREEALAEILESFVENRGIFSAEEIGRLLGLSTEKTRSYLAAIEAKGSLVSGTFLKSGQRNYCARRLLMRMHRETLERLREKIKPVAPDVFMRFLVWHHHLTNDNRVAGPGGTLTAVSQLAGFQAPAYAWEREILVSRIEGYDPAWLDQLCYGGQVAWDRFLADNEEGAKTFHRAIALTMFPRTMRDWIAPRSAFLLPKSSDAQRLLDALKEGGALFWDELVRKSGILPSRAEEAMRELIALGLVQGDGFAAIRPLIDKKRHSARVQGPRSRGIAGLHLGEQFLFGGRWSLKIPTNEVAPDDRLTEWVWQLLKRYGVIFYELLSRESLAPRWGSLLPVMRRLEARGEIRGGRFVTGIRGEQFALPEAVDMLRRIRDEQRYQEAYVIASSDPLNLVGILKEGQRLAPAPQNVFAIYKGEVVAIRQGDDVEYFGDIPPEIRQELSYSLTITGRVRALRRTLETPET